MAVLPPEKARKEMKRTNSQKKTERNYDINALHIPSADSKRDVVEYKALLKALDAIDKAKQNGEYRCYVVSGGYLPKSIIQKLIDAGYDLSYHYFKHDAQWFVKASWQDGCSGKIYRENDFGKGHYVTIDEMFQI